MLAFFLLLEASHAVADASKGHIPGIVLQEPQDWV